VDRCAILEDDDEQDLRPLPPDSECWDWPLSRHEKKSRIQQLERQMNASDRKALIQELRRSWGDNNSEGSA